MEECVESMNQMKVDFLIELGDFKDYTLKAMVDGSGNQNNSYAIVQVFDDGSISITGYRKAVSKNLS
jgi:hypothetical protein